ncbi:MAG: DUF3822 family protein [Bacteroidota bacterium]
MTRKIIGYYSETGGDTATDADQLVVEISRSQVVCLVKGSASQEIEGFEMFELDKENKDWNDVFYALRNESLILNRSFRNAHCYYNFEEAIIIPGKRFTAGSSEDYLNLMYGETDRHDTRYDPINADTPQHMVNAYRIRKSIHELVGRHYLLYKPYHTYTALLQDVFSRTELADHFIKVQFYKGHIIVAVVKKQQLQLIQSFPFSTKDDILYHLANTSDQFALDASHSHLEISGSFENGSVLHQQLQSMFGLITFDTMYADGVFKSAIAQPLHYFTPFYKLVV